MEIVYTLLTAVIGLALLGSAGYMFWRAPRILDECCVLDVLQRKEAWNATGIATEFGLPLRYVLPALRRLQQKGSIEKLLKPGNGDWYRLTGKGKRILIQQFGMEL